MPIYNRIAEFQDDLIATRRDIHENPELGFEENRTSDLVAKQLESWGIEVHRDIAKTGLVGVLKGNGNSSRTIGIRADMDALPMSEEGTPLYKSKNDGKMHACGHDGHTTMLLGAARYLAETRNFDGTVNFIFQPAEEGGGGGRVMVEEGVFEHENANYNCQSSGSAYRTMGAACYGSICFRDRGAIGNIIIH